MASVSAQDFLNRYKSIVGRTTQRPINSKTTQKPTSSAKVKPGHYKNEIPGTNIKAGGGITVKGNSVYVDNKLPPSAEKALSKLVAQKQAQANQAGRHSASIARSQDIATRMSYY